ncbi:sialate O-acetylesterase [Gaoshiqia sediminis]|uniref:Sialate O-acetylesterase n=1 Tax=Gaoshiqia sediminis TaxID=2986998 RepID=A0AA41YDU5_9BACT|nr:sialate O-acetylesterase [Gaoshiqia sediminis]MCW0484945.1 sialate O-acetylesterase [Gaoshiqia sediminis]
MNKFKLFVLIVLLFSGTYSFSQDPDFHIYLCFGQSNMAGAARAEAQDSIVDARFQMMSAMDCPDKGRKMGNWYTATPPLCDCNAGISPADYFGRTLLASLPGNIRIGVINVSVGGCRIELFDKENYQSYVETAPDWMLNWINNYGGNPYARLVEMARLAQKDGVIKGILLHQGESNPNDTLWTQKVKGVYDNLMNDLNLDPTKTPLLAGELLSAEFEGKCFAFNQFIAQLPEVIPNAHIISSEGCPGMPDGLHFTAEGYRILGKRYGEKMLSLLIENKTGLMQRVVEDGGTGAYKAIMSTDNSLPTHTIFRPDDLGVFGKKNQLPIIVWGNGACANSPWEHVNFLSEVASHGFLTIAIGPMPKEGERGQGRSASSQLLDAIDWAIAQNNDKSSVFYKKIDVSKIAVSGMSCGGLQTLEVAPDPRVTTAVVCNSGIIGNGGGMPGMPSLKKEHLAKLHSPTLYLLGGESDIAYKNGMDDYNRINHVPVFVANMDVGHGGTYGQPHGGEFAIVATAWYKWQLKGDQEAGKMFTGNPCQLSKSTVWKVDKKNLP